MAPVSIKFVVSFSSQDDNHKVSNIVDNTGFKRWLSHPKEKSGKIEAVFQLEKLCLISFIDVGSVWCANMELQVGRSDWVQGVEYKTLLPTVCLTSPSECKTGQGVVKNRLFSAEHFCTDVSKEKWDRIKVICRQPFRKDVQYGLSFIRIRSADKSAPEDTRNLLKSSNHENKDGASPHSKDNSIVKSIQKHFFGRKYFENKDTVDPVQSRLLKIAGTSEHGVEQEGSLPRTAKLVLAATENIGKSSVQARTKSNSSVRGQLFSEHLVHKYPPKFEDEVTEFLGTLDLEDIDLDEITIADLRHKFEKSQEKKLSGDEKIIFMELCQNYICDLFDKSNETSRLPSNSVTGAENQQMCIPSRKRKANDDMSTFSPKTPKTVITSDTDCHIPISERNTPNNKPSKLMNSFNTKSPSSSRIISHKKTHSIESERTDNRNSTPSKSIQMERLSLMSPTNSKHCSSPVAGKSPKDSNSNYIHNSPSTKLVTSSTGKKHFDHSRVASLVQAIKNNFPKSVPSPARKPPTKGVINPLGNSASVKQSNTKSFPYRGLELEIGPVNSRKKAPPIKKLVSDIHDSMSGLSNQWLSKETGIGLNCNSPSPNAKNSSATPTATRTQRGRGSPRVRGANTKGGKCGRGMPNARSRGGSTGKSRGGSSRKKLQEDKWMEADTDLCSSESSIQNSVVHDYVYCSSCKGNVPEHLFSHHHLTCRPSNSSASSTSSGPNSGLHSISSTPLTSQDDKYQTISSSNSEDDLQIDVWQNPKHVPCPICNQLFAEDVIMTHANFCCETIGF